MPGSTSATRRSRTGPVVVTRTRTAVTSSPTHTGSVPARSARASGLPASASASSTPTGASNGDHAPAASRVETAMLTDASGSGAQETPTSGALVSSTSLVTVAVPARALDTAPAVGAAGGSASGTSVTSGATGAGAAAGAGAVAAGAVAAGVAAAGSASRDPLTVTSAAATAAARPGRQRGRPERGRGGGAPQGRGTTSGVRGRDTALPGGATGRSSPSRQGRRPT